MMNTMMNLWHRILIWIVVWGCSIIGFLALMVRWPFSRKKPKERDWERIYHIHCLMAAFMDASIALEGEPCVTISYNALDENAPYSVDWIQGSPSPPCLIPGEHREEQIIEFTELWRRAAWRKSKQEKDKDEH